MFSHFRLMNDLALSHTWCAHITDWGVGAMLFHVVLLESRGLTRFGFDMLCPTPCDPVEPSMLTIVIIICIHVVNIHTLFCHNLILVDCIMLFSGNYGVSGKLKCGCFENDRNCVFYLWKQLPFSNRAHFRNRSALWNC